MQIISLEWYYELLICFILWPILQVIAALICLYLPNHFYKPHSWFFKSHKWENQGTIYNTLFRISKWKHLLPDGAKASKKRGYQKKHLTDYSIENLNLFLIESCRGELSHWLAVTPFWIFGFFTPYPVVWLMLLYALIINLPCIIAQRYNRPRIIKLIERKNVSS